MSKQSIWKRCIVLIFVNLFFAKVWAQDLPCSFKFSLTKKLTTSAGIYKKDGQLVRTLWNNKVLEKGEHTGQWDRKNDEGQLVKDTSLQVRILTNAIQVEWEGVIGNNSDSMTGSSKMRAYDRINSMVVSGRYAYYSTGYAEGANSTFKFDLLHPHNKINILPNEHKNVDLLCEYVATDGELVYWTGYDPYKSEVSFTFATKVVDDLEFQFDKGKPQSTFYGRTYPSVINLIANNPNGHPSGMAVQKKGSYLFIAHVKLNQISVIDKKTGALIQTLNYDSPREIATDNEGNLWMITGANQLCKYPINKDGTLGVASVCLDNLAEPLALTLSPNGYRIIVIDGGNSQQLKFYLTSSGQFIFSHGEEGGYSKDPTVNDHKFYFNDTVTGLTKPYLAFQADSNLWIGDVGNERTLLFNSHLECIDRIMSLPHSYSIAVDRNNPTRVFNQYLEFQINYSKKLSPDNGSWTLVRNYRHGILPAYYQSDKIRIFIQLITLDNGKTYALLDEYDNGIRKPEVIELPDKSNIVYSGIKLKDFASDLIDTNGDLVQVSLDPHLNNKGYFIRSKLNGYINGWPNWSSFDTLSYIPPISRNDPAYLNTFAPVTNGSKFYIFQAGKATDGFHLGCINYYDSSYIWKTCPSTDTDYSGPMPGDGTFDIGNGVEYAGGGAYAMDAVILWNYHGEFWKNAQTNIWNLFHEDGLMLLQFGTTTPDGERISEEAFPMGAGNVFSSTLVKIGETLYLYHNDESVHGGVHRWKIGQLNSINIISIPLELNEKTTGGLKGMYFSGKDFDPCHLVAERIDPVIANLKLPYQFKDNQAYSIRHTGYLQADKDVQANIRCQSDFGCRVFINDTLLIDNDNSNTLQANIVLNALSPIKITVEQMDTNAYLQWNIDGTWKTISSDHLIPDEFDISSEIDLMYGLKPDTYLEDGYYGWSIQSSHTRDSFVVARTRVKYFENNRFDLYMSHSPEDSVLSIKRSIDGLRLCENGWSISGLINFDGTGPDADGRGFNLLVMDSHHDTLCKIRYDYLKAYELGFPSTLTCNGAPYLYGSMYNLFGLLSKNNPFAINFTEQGVQFSIGDYIPMRASYYSNTADWKHPAYLEFLFDNHKDESKNISVSELKLRGQATIRIDNLDKTVICEGEQIEIQTNSTLENQKWNTNEQTPRITISKSGLYYLKTTRSSGCTYHSDTFELKVESSGLKINRKGDSLISSANGNKKWFLNGKLIDTSSSLKMKEIGEYKLLCINNIGCKDSSVIDILELSNNVQPYQRHRLFPNPVQSDQPICIQTAIGSRITIYTIDGRMVYNFTSTEPTNELIIEKGIYFIKIESELGTIIDKIIVL